MNLRHLKAVARKEMLHIVRDRGTFLLVTVGPIFLMMVFAFTMTSEVKNVTVAIVDQADNAESQELIKRIDASEVVTVDQHLATVGEADELFLENEIVAVIVIPESYSTVSLTNFEPVSAVIDGTEPVSAEEVLNEVYAITDAHTREIAQEKMAVSGFAADAGLFDEPVLITTERLYNSEARSVVDFYPGLAAMMLTLPAIALAMSLARENEMGTLEQLVASPISKKSLLPGKMLPYLAFGMLDVYVLLVLGWVVYDVPFKGSLIDYSILALLFMAANLGLALLIAVLFRSQQVAMLVSILVFFIPPFFLSGLFFPIDAMPWIIQLEMIEFPATHYVAASKAIQLKGTSLLELWFPVVILFILAVELQEIAAFIFRKKVILTFSWRKLFGKGEAHL